MYFAFYSVCLYYGVVEIVSADSSNDVNKGHIDLGNLLFDDCYLVETSAPAGYIPLTSPIIITVSDTEVIYN